MLHHQKINNTNYRRCRWVAWMLDEDGKRSMRFPPSASSSPQFFEAESLFDKDEIQVDKKIVLNHIDSCYTNVTNNWSRCDGSVTQNRLSYFYQPHKSPHWKTIPCEGGLRKIETRSPGLFWCQAPLSPTLSHSRARLNYISHPFRRHWTIYWDKKKKTLFLACEKLQVGECLEFLI